MALNPFFLQGSTNEQFLVQDLINEQLKIYGVDVYYLPRKVLKEDSIIREIQSSKFDDSFLIEAYLDNYDGYAPGSDIMTKFGLRLKNEVNLIISRERYEEFISPFLEGIISGVKEGKNDDVFDLNSIERPSEGDLIYFPLGERLFEVKRVEFEKPFYQLGKTYVYELLCELYEYENEDIDTSIEEIDNTVKDEGYITTLNLEGIGQTATATATLGGVGMVGQIILNEDGYNYTSTPSVTIAPPTSGITATAVAITTSIGSVRSVKSIRITNAGSGYTSSNPPTVTITGGNGIGAAATAVIVDNGIQYLSISNVGSGYYITPTVTIGPSVGQTATAYAVLNNDGGVSSLQLINAGYGYTEAPTVSISGVSTTGIGTFVYNETVTGSLSGTTAVVREFKRRTDLNAVDPPIELRVAINNGQFSAGEVITGAASSATYILKSYDNDSYEDSYDINEEIELEADNILDFTESNPFGEY